ncbi:MAG: hypothetical protein MOGMAGMI_01243 [Candidatus Omnitrophica bacterium]|nr:hypothetical protein [Candidatus Omnitrophota bacterium]
MARRTRQGSGSASDGGSDGFLMMDSIENCRRRRALPPESGTKGFFDRMVSAQRYREMVFYTRCAERSR